MPGPSSQGSGCLGDLVLPQPHETLQSSAGMASFNSHRTCLYLIIWSAVILFLASLIPTVSAVENTRWIQYTGNDGTVWLDDARRPSLYTQDFGDCQGDSLINVTRFDAAYYKDNMTVLFHLEGDTALADESLMRESSCI